VPASADLRLAGEVVSPGQDGSWSGAVSVDNDAIEVIQALATYGGKVDAADVEVDVVELPVVGVAQ
jgi:hypothetical protein